MWVRDDGHQALVRVCGLCHQEIAKEGVEIVLLYYEYIVISCFYFLYYRNVEDVSLLHI